MNALVMHPVTKANLTLGSGDASTFTVTDDGGGVTVVRAADATTALAAADAAQLVLASEALGSVPHHSSLPGLLGDDHPQYHTDARGDARYDALGTYAAGMAAHLATVDPHPQYLTPAEGNAAYEVIGTMTAHLAAGDPHPQYLTAAEGNAAYSLLGHTHVAANITDFNSAADARVAAGNAASASKWQTGRTITLTGMVTGVSGAFDGSANLSFAAALGSFTMAQLDAAVSDGDVSYVGHTHVLATGATDVSITAANLNVLDDGADTALHFHSADRSRANHTGTQLASTISDFSEAVDDRVGALLVAGTNITLTYNDGANTLTIDASSGGGSGLSDGDYGDITVSGSGTVISIDAGVVDTAELADGGVTYAKMQDVSATARVLGRKTAGAGDVEELTGSDVRALFEGTVVLAADNTVNTTALADVTGMSFTADASSTYIVELIGTFQTAATTTGIGLALNIPSGGIMGQALVHLANATLNNVQQVADDAVLATSTGVAAANTNYPITAKWLVKIDATGGTVQLRQRSEVAASNTVLKAGTATIPGTVMTWKKVA